MKDKGSWVAPAMLYGGIAIMALSSSPHMIAGGALLAALGVNQASERETRRRLDALEKHLTDRIQYLERQLDPKTVSVDEIVAKFRRDRDNPPD